MVDGRVHPATMPMSSPALNSAAMRGPAVSRRSMWLRVASTIELMTFQTRDRIPLPPRCISSRPRQSGHTRRAGVRSPEAIHGPGCRVGDTWRLETRPSLPECAGAASGCVLLPGISHLGLEHRAAWAETKPDGTVTPRWTVESAWIRSAIPTPRLWRCCWPR